MTVGAASICRRVCSVEGVATEVLRIDACGGPARLQAVVFPGNPGSAAYFRKFMASLYEQLGGRADVLAVTHAGHDPATDYGGRLWDLSQQIAHKVAFLREHVLLPGRPPVVLVGHSIGAAMAIKAVAQLEGLRGGNSQHQEQQEQEPPVALDDGGKLVPEGATRCSAGHEPESGPLPGSGGPTTPSVVKVVAVFPFFETNFPGNSRQRRLRSLAPWYEALGWVGAAVTSLPTRLRLAFVRLNASMDRDAVELTSQLLSRHTVRNAFFLASHEFRELSQPWDWALMSALGRRLHVMGCEHDTWMSRQQFDDMCARVPGLQATWHPDLRHAFCISDRQSAAVAGAVAAIAESWAAESAAAAAARSSDGRALTASPSAVSVSHATDTATSSSSYDGEDEAFGGEDSNGSDGGGADRLRSVSASVSAAIGGAVDDSPVRVRTSVKRKTPELPSDQSPAVDQPAEQAQLGSRGNDAGSAGKAPAASGGAPVVLAGPGAGADGGPAANADVEVGAYMAAAVTEPVVAAAAANGGVPEEATAEAGLQHRQRRRRLQQQPGGSEGGQSAAEEATAAPKAVRLRRGRAQQ
ncbi:hypothetical protein GPECTOR_5g390 [Gonium pectorale]|uniref:Uncharacterized protein n=1 Tax=Gonium pectorale TaxID=33097 RepID=A0A150GWX4_GONPE|nr:hypothetical protein GPECTOR_5g390 [Gonium pectorale]|eukprot:KXZ54305.1 hypothetical protein GPECTOR_5g390 [Gonium pectorale]